MKDPHKMFCKTVNSLPQAFENGYWTMADTSFKEELLMTYIEENRLPNDEALKILRACKITVRNNPIVYLWLSKDVEQGMGVFTGITVKGKKALKRINGF